MTSTNDRPNFSPEELKAKYAAEREKRLRTDGNEQYIDPAEIYRDFNADPYVTPGFTRPAVADTTDVVIIGGGFGGILAAARLRQAGINNFRIIEKGGDFGGTWYWNRYPGAACDVESYIYLPMLEETGYVPTEKYAKATEIFAHCKRLGEHFDLYPAALFQTEVSAVRWDDATNLWTVTTDRNDRIQARFVVIAGGILHKAKLPGIPGLATFKGHSFHTSRWDYAYTGGSPTTPMDKLANKRVAIIGTGATAVQAVPKLGEAAQQLYVFQRTPSGVGARNNQLTDPQWAQSLKPGWQQERIENFTCLVSGRKQDRDLINDGWTEIFHRELSAGAASATPEEEANLRQMADFETMEAIRARIDAIVKDPATAAALKPWYNQMCKRPCFHDEYLPTFNRPNVKLVDTDGKGVERITETEYPVDCLIFASGFEVATNYNRRLGFEIYGRGGVPMTEAWADGPATLHGVTARGFPNLLMFSAIQGGWAINFLHMINELSEHTAWIIKNCLERGVVIEPTPAAQEQWWEVIMGTLMKNALFQAECTPSYQNGEGTRDVRMIKNAAFMNGTMEFIDILRQWRAGDAFADLECTSTAKKTT
jgi:cyclohexanone monooxygenase